MIDLREKRVLVIGMGISGRAAAALCLRRGALVTAADVRPIAAWSEDARALKARGAVVIEGRNPSEREAADADLVIVSPGVPKLDVLYRNSLKKPTIWGEIELSVQALATPARIVAVGGTNGKSTTTTLIGEIAKAAGRRVFVGGNLGEPLADHADEPFDDIVLEVSSFQMEDVESFKPAISILLNVTPDHLDRYDSFDDYAAAKGNAFRMQTERDLAIIPSDQPSCRSQATRGSARIVTFGSDGDVRIESDAIVDTVHNTRYARAAIALRGGHNALNVAAAIAAAAELGIPTDVVRSTLASFQGLPHRTALVAEVAGVRFYDDSKGTNVGASVTAILGLDEPRVVLIAGGKDKGGSYAPLASALRERGRAVVLIGEASDQIEAAVGDALPVHRATTMVDAVRLAARAASRGDAVLLSPACSSFDMFRDYKHRGDEFVAAVRDLLARGDHERS